MRVRAKRTRVSAAARSRRHRRTKLARLRIAEALIDCGRVSETCCGVDPVPRRIMRGDSTSEGLNAGEEQSEGAEGDRGGRPGRRESTLRWKSSCARCADNWMRAGPRCGR